MATVTITIADSVLARVVNGVAGATGYEAESGMTKEQHMKKVIRDWIRNTVVDYERQKAAEAAAAAVSEVEV